MCEVTVELEVHGGVDTDEADDRYVSYPRTPEEAAARLARDPTARLVRRLVITTPPEQITEEENR